MLEAFSFLFGNFSKLKYFSFGKFLTGGYNMLTALKFAPSRKRERAINLTARSDDYARLRIAGRDDFYLRTSAPGQVRGYDWHNPDPDRLLPTIHGTKR